MKRTCKLSLSFLCFLICFLLSMSGIRARDEALAADIAPKILRFHVLANSDSAKDQALKLRVKDLLLEKIRDGIYAVTDRNLAKLCFDRLTACGAIQTEEDMSE